MPTIRNKVLERYSYQEAEKFIQELAWREYWQHVWQVKGGSIFSDLRFTRTDWQHHELVTAIIDAATGITAIDHAVTKLQETGYMHNHARMWVAMLATNVAKAHWLPMAKWMYFYLMDGDLASNMLSWQWIAGTNAGKRYLANQDLINACADTDDAGTVIDCERDAVGGEPVPEIMLKHEPFSFRTKYPLSDELPDFSESGEIVLLYSPWTLDPDWYGGMPAQRILVIEPSLFDAYPVAEHVMQFIIDQARLVVPGLKVYVGEAASLRHNLPATHVRSSPALANWPGIKDDPPRLFPDVTGYYQSFSKFWEACQKSKSSR